MDKETASALKQFIRTSNAVLKVLIYLIEDLKPIICGRRWSRQCRAWLMQNRLLMQSQRYETLIIDWKCLL
jgi:hypothetical protein